MCTTQGRAISKEMQVSLRPLPSLHCSVDASKAKDTRNRRKLRQDTLTQVLTSEEHRREALRFTRELCVLKCLTWY